MSEKTLPKILKYNQVKPKGLPSSFKRWEITPLASQQSYTVNDLIRFQFQTDKFIDPYAVYFEIQVEVPQNATENMPLATVVRKPKTFIYDDPDQNSNILAQNGLQRFIGSTTAAQSSFTKNKAVIVPDYSNVCAYLLDGSAGSIISETILYSNGREVERQQEYDQLSNIIQDFGVSKFTRGKQIFQGYKQMQNFCKNQFNFENEDQMIIETQPDQPMIGIYNASYPSYTNNYLYKLALQSTGLANDTSTTIPTTDTKYLLQQNLLLGSQKTQLGQYFASLNTLSSSYEYFIKTYSNSQVQYSQSNIKNYLNNGIEQTQTSFIQLGTESLQQQLQSPYKQITSATSSIGFDSKYITSAILGNNTPSLQHLPGVYQSSSDAGVFTPIQDYIQGNNNIIGKINNIDYCKYNNLMRNICLSDSSQTIEHYQTISGTMFNSLIKHQYANTDNVLPMQTNFKLPYLAYQNGTNYNILKYNGQEQFPISEDQKKRKRLLFNESSQYNFCDFICPGVAQQRWINGKPVTDYKFGVPQLSINQNLNLLSDTNLTSVFGDKTSGTYDPTKQIQIPIDSTSLEYTYATTKKTFYIPFLSGVLGHLIPENEWKLIPGEGCGVMNLEVRLNRFAFWMSGHKLNTTDGTDVDLATNQSYQFHNGKTSNGWRIKKISLHMDLWDFGNEIKQMIRQKLEQGILFSSQTFQLGPQYSISQSSQLKGNWSINNNVQSAKRLYFWFIDDRYQQYNFLRKQFRLSHNLKSYQLKCGSEFVPEQPIQGHAGNLNEPNNSTQGNFYPFYMELLRAHNELFTPDSKMNILPSAYIVNDRAFDPSKHGQSIMQSGVLHETRLNGKAIYCLDFEADPFDSSVFSGKNIGQFKPVDLVLDIHSGTEGGDFTSNSTMYMFLHCDQLVQFSLNGIETVV